MRKYLLPENCELYKANLHSHSTFSDGKLTPEEMKAEYMKRGYSIIAFTDHEVLFTHNELSDENFLALNGSEISIEQPAEENGFFKVCHLCLISKDKNNMKQVCFHPNYLWYFPDEIADLFVNEKRYFGEFYNRVYSVDGINEIIKIAKEHNFFVTYNHIGWNRESLVFVSQLENYDGFEVCNYRSVKEGKDFYNIALYEDLLRQGKRPFPIAGDDNHNIPLFDTSTDLDFCDSFGAFTYIAAPDLSYESVVAAMEKGDLYVSAGPKIKSLYYEDGNYYIETCPVREIFLRAGNRHSFRVASSDGKPITSAVLEGFENDIYVRFSAIDFEGNAADTRAYDLKEFI